MKIIMINTVAIEGNAYTYGLGEDNNLYEWSNILRKWIISGSALDKENRP